MESLEVTSAVLPSAAEERTALTSPQQNARCHLLPITVASYASRTPLYPPPPPNKPKKIPWPLVRERTIPTEPPPLVGEI
jgi:hypothetical protein